MDQTLVEQIVARVLNEMKETSLDCPAEPQAREEGIPVGVSNRHIHLSREHVEVLFGAGHELTRAKELSQVGEFAAAQTVTLVGPTGVLQGVRVLGPVRSFSQAEISRTDGFLLGIKPPLRDSGRINESAGVTVVGPKGAVTLAEGVICAARHLHMNEADAACYGVGDGDRMAVQAKGPRGVTFENVLVRVSPNFRLEFHIDTDEANAAGLNNGDWVCLKAGGG